MFLRTCPLIVQPLGTSPLVVQHSWTHPYTKLPTRNNQVWGSQYEPPLSYSYTRFPTLWTFSSIIIAHPNSITNLPARNTFKHILDPSSHWEQITKHTAIRSSPGGATTSPGGATTPPGDFALQIAWWFKSIDEHHTF